MKDRKKLWNKIRKNEKDILVASPKRAAKLAVKIAKWKGQVFDE